MTYRRLEYILSGHYLNVGFVLFLFSPIFFNPKGSTDSIGTIWVLGMYMKFGKNYFFDERFILDCPLQKLESWKYFLNICWIHGLKVNTTQIKDGDFGLIQSFARVIY